MTLELALRLCLVFGSASLLSFGGGNAIVPQLQLRTVETYHWLTAGQFADSFHCPSRAGTEHVAGVPARL